MTYISNIMRSQGDPKLIQTGPSSLSSADKLARALWVVQHRARACRIDRPQLHHPGAGAARKGKPGTGLWGAGDRSRRYVTVSRPSSRTLEPGRR